MLTPAQGITYNKFEVPNDWPKIDKTFDYKIENGKLLSGNEHIYLSGPVTYTKVGNPTIVDGIVSGFSDSDYLSIGSFTPTTSWEAVFRVKTPSTAGSKYFLGSLGYGLVVGSSASADKVVMKLFCSSNGSSWDLANIAAIGQLELDTLYYIRFGFSGTEYYIEHSSDGITYTGRNTSNSTTNIISSNLLIGTGYGTGYYWPNEIDLNETYIKVNDRLWFYGKNYTTKNMVPVPAGLEYNNTTTPEIGWIYTSNELVKGPVTYTKVGNPKIVNGVVSGFSSSNYLITSANVPNTTTSVSGQVAFITSDTFADENLSALYFYHFRVGWSAGSRSWPAVGVYDGGVSKNLAMSSLAELQYNTKYKLKFELTATKVSMWLYSANDTLIDTKFVDGDFEIPTQDTIRIGGTGGVIALFHTSIDLNETYIKVDGQPWFGNVSKFQQFTPAPKGTMIGKDETEMLQVETYQDKGIVNYTVVGTPTIVNGIASGFSASNYLKVGSGIPSISSFEFNIKFTVPSTYVDNATLLSYSTAGIGYLTAYCMLAGNGYIGAYLFKKSDNTQQRYDAQYDLREHLNETFTFNIKTDMSSVYVNLYNANGVLVQSNTYSNQNLGGYIASSILIGVRDGLSNPFNGSIDLNETYIKVDGQYWFHPYPNSYPKLVGPVSYTTVGSPTISNGVISYTSDGNYIQSTSALAIDQNSDIEIYVRFNKGSIDNGATSIVGYNTKWSNAIVRLTNHSFNSAINGGSTSVFTGYGNVLDNTWYRAKCTLKNGVETAILYADDGTKINEGSANVTVTSREYKVLFSCNYGNNAPVQYVDLNNTYIKVNGALWFGKEDWTPSTYTDNAIYLLSGHKSDYSQYNELGINPIIATDSDEVGTYDVWIDDQKVLENQNTPNTIDWSKLALTTGYSITTPSSLKAHVVQIKPTNSEDKIVAFSSFEDSDESI